MESSRDNNGCRYRSLSFLVFTISGKRTTANVCRKLKIYATTADILRMKIDYSGYEQRGNVKDIVLTPTEQTEHTMERWKAVSKAFPTIEFPQKEVEEGNWMKVYEEITRSFGEMQSVPLVLLNGEEVGGTESLYLYVHNGNIEEDNFENFLKEKGIIE